MRNLSPKHMVTVICLRKRSYSKKREHNGAGSKIGKGLGVVTVRARPGDQRKGILNAGGMVFSCAFGGGGIISDKREGDGATPLAAMRIMSGYYRRDSLPLPPTRLKMVPIGPRLGWCDAPQDRNYNRPVKRSYPASHENMRRDDHLYDVCLVLDWNISPRRRGRGSAIFFHLARPGYTPTHGCVAISARDMARLLPHLSNRTILKVVR